MKIKLTLFILIPLLFIGCSLFDTQHQMSYRQVQFSINSNDGRTMIPETFGVSKYLFSFTGNSVIDTVDFSLYETKSVLLPDGEWTIEVEALNSNDLVVATGSTSVNIPDILSVNINIAPKITATGSGDFQLYFSYTLPEGNQMGTITPYLTNLDTQEQVELSIDSSSSTLIITGEDVVSGSHLLSIEMENSNGLTMVPFMDVVHIYDNVTTSESINLVSNHFDSIPSTPMNFSATEQMVGVALSWDDYAINETSIIVERKDGDGEFSVLVELASNTESYLDDTTIDGVNYSYRVKSSNLLGSSDATEIIEITISNEYRILHVTVDGTGSGDSWSNALSDPQEAINLAATYSRTPQIWVAMGRYTPQSNENNTSEEGRQYNHFSLKPNISIFGGFDGTETEFNQRKPFENITELSGDFNNDDIVTGFWDTLEFSNIDENAYNVFYHPSSLNLSGDEVIDGFTISGGNASISTNNNGGGIYLSQKGFTIKNSIFKNNNAKYGGAIYSSTANIIIDNVVFDTNMSSSSGGAIYQLGNGSHINNSLFINNESNHYGGAIYSSDGSVYVHNSIIYGNHANYYGAVYLKPYSYYTVSLNNSILYGNSSNYSSNNFYLSLDRNYDVSINNVYITDLVSDSVLNSGIVFVNSENPIGDDNIWFTDDDGLYPDENSTTIDGGHTNYIFEGIDPLVNGNSIDMGNYESSYVDNIAPVDISDVQLESLNGSVKLTWMNPIDMDLKHIEIESYPVIIDESLYVNYSLEEYIIAGLTNNQEYTFTLYTEDFAGNRSDGIEINGSPLFADIPDVIEYKTFVSNNRVSLSWKNPEDFIYKNVQLHYGDNIIIFDNSEESYIISDLINGDEYTFTINVSDYGDSLSEGQVITAIPVEQVFVDIDASGTGDGSSWENAATNLSYVLESVSAGTEIWVAEGIYIPQTIMGSDNNTDDSDSKYYNYYIPNNISLYGGFSGSESSLDDRDFGLYKTELSGDVNQDDIISGSGTTLEISNNSENLYHVIYQTVDAENSEVNGFYITGGNAANSNGGGMYFPNSINAPLLRYCVFYGNRTISSGGGIYVNQLCDITLENVVFINNKATEGSAIYNYGISKLRNTVAYGNNGYSYIFNTRDMRIYSSTFVNNGGRLKDNYNMQIYNSIEYANQNNPYISNSTVINSIMDSDKGIMKTGVDFIEIDDPDGADDMWFTEDDGLFLTSESMGLKIADMDHMELVLTDLIGQTRGSENADIGAYEALYDDGSAPGNVFNLTIEQTEGVAILNWSDPVNLDLDYLEITWTPENSITQPLIVEKGIETVSIADINIGSRYDFTVKSVDYRGNSSTGYLIHKDLTTCSLTLDLPQDETITLNKSDGIELTMNSTLYVSVSETFDSYKWYLDSEEITGNESDDISIDCSELSAGPHRLLCVVYKDGIPYSKNLYFDISNN